MTNQSDDEHQGGRKKTLREEIFKLGIEERGKKNAHGMEGG